MPRAVRQFGRERVVLGGGVAGNATLVAGRPARHFCYPNGIYRADFFPWLRELGVISATTCEPGLASSQTELLCTPRLVDGSSLTEAEFEGWLCGISAALPSAPHAH